MSGGGTDGFDRIKPPDERIMQRRSGPRLDDLGTDPDGRAALFSAGAGPSSRSRHSGAAKSTGIAVHCSRCDETTPVDAATALRSAVPLFLVLPWRDHPVFALCPACQHRAWLRPSPPSSERP